MIIRDFKKIALLCAAITLVPAIAGAQQSTTTPKKTTAPTSGGDRGHKPPPATEDLAGSAGKLKKTPSEKNVPLSEADRAAEKALKNR